MFHETAPRKQACAVCANPSASHGRALKRSALACRRSTAALAAASERRSSAPVRASWDLVGAHDPDGSKDRARFNGRYPLLPVPVQRLASQTGHYAGRALSRSRPSAAVTSGRPREPHSFRQPASPAGVLHAERGLIRGAVVSETETNVKRRRDTRDAHYALLLPVAKNT